MANQEQLNLLKQGNSVWNAWRKQHEKVQPDLREADLREADLREADLREADLSGAILDCADLSGANLSKANLKGADLFDATLRNADLSGANLSYVELYGAILIEADLSGADLSRSELFKAHLNGADLSKAKLYGTVLSKAWLIETNFAEAILKEADLSLAILNCADLSGADLSQADLRNAVLRGADLSKANLSEATLYGADLSKADLKGADLSFARLIETNFAEATLTNCNIYGISAWGVELKGAIQNNLVITPDYEPTITVDNLKIAQFIYLLLNNAEIRDVIDTIAKKVVLILGRFTHERKAVLDALKEALRTEGYLPILFDFDKPSSRDLTETVRTLAHLSRFIIADLTLPRSIPQELQAIIPHLAVAVQPLLNGSKRAYGMFQDFKKYSWVLPVYRYKDLDGLLNCLKEKVIDPAEQKAKELENR